MKQVTLIRGYTLRKLKELRMFISCLPEREEEALQAMNGPEGVKTAAAIADYVLEQLGHPAPKNTADGSPTLKAARQVVGNGRRA